MAHYSFSNTHLSSLHDLSSPMHALASPLHDLTSDEWAGHPSLLWRILFFTIPFSLIVLVSINLYRKERTQQDSVIEKIQPPPLIVTIIGVISMAGAAITGVYAVIVDAWTLMEWFLFATICFIWLIKTFISQGQNSQKLVSKLNLYNNTVISILIALIGFWFTVTLFDMSAATESDRIWKHITLNLVGFFEACMLINSVQSIWECMLRLLCSQGEGVSAFFGMIASIMFQAYILNLRVKRFRSFIDQIGFIAASILLLIGAIYKSEIFQKCCSDKPDNENKNKDEDSDQYGL